MLQLKNTHAANWNCAYLASAQRKTSCVSFSPMAESKPDTEVKSPNLFERAQEDMRAILHHHHETHGMRDDIDENTPLSDVKAPNLIERAKEEIEALVQTIHPQKELRDQVQKAESKSDHDIMDLIERKKKEFAAILHHDKLQHHKETHGMRDDIDENTSISDVKAPNIFERAKEEIEALVQTIHPKKEHPVSTSTPKKEGFMMHIGSLFEKVCAPWGNKKD